MVGKLSRIRVSSVTRTLPPRTSVGTLKSTRTSTRFPRTSRSRTVKALPFLLVTHAPAHAHDQPRNSAFVFTQELRSFRKSLQHSHEHVHDSDEPVPLAGRIRSAATSFRTVSTSRHAAHSSAEPRAISRKRARSTVGEFPISFCDVQGETGRSAIELIFCSCFS